MLPGLAKAALRSRRALGVLLACVLGSAGCAPDGPRANGPNVLIVTIDSLRADRLGCYGYERDTSPALDALSREGVRFERAYSHAPFTPPAHASLLTGLHVPSHGVFAWAEELSADARTLGERFGPAGWRTGAFSNHPGLATSHVYRGFEHVEERFFEEAGPTVDAFLGWIDGEDEDGAFCAWVHLWDVHRPYGFRDWTPEWARERVERDELTLAFDEELFGPAPARDGVLVGRREGHYNVNASERARAFQVGAGQRLFDAADWRYIENRYDGGIRAADRGIAHLVEGLRARGLLDDTILVITADHGESLTEREACWFTHDPFVYEQTLHVPLIVRFPAAVAADTVVADPVRHVDVLPTLLELAGLAARGDEQGSSLLGLLAGTGRAPGPVFAQTQTLNAKESTSKIEAGAGWLEQRLALIDGSWKLIVDRSEGRVELYDLAQDAEERENLAALPEHTAVRARLEANLEALEAGLPRAEGQRGVLDPQVQSILKEIGYVGD